MQNTIQKTQSYLYDFLNQSDAKQYEIDYRYEHSLRVSNIGLAIAKEVPCNGKVVVLACLLHDLCKFESNNNNHGRASAIEARNFLTKLDITSKEVDDICYAIAVHVDGQSGYAYPDILEAKIVKDADCIDRFSSSKIKQRLIWSKKDEKLDKQGKINRLNNQIKKNKKLLINNPLTTDLGKQLFKQKLELQIHFDTQMIQDLLLTNTPQWHL